MDKETKQHLLEAYEIISKCEKKVYDTVLVSRFMQLKLMLATFFMDFDVIEKDQIIY